METEIATRQDAIQEGFQNDDGSMTWGELHYLTLDTKKNLFRRWKDAGTFESHNIVEIPGGIEVDTSLSKLIGCRQRLYWNYQSEIDSQKDASDS